MKRLWQTYVERMEIATLRERAVIFGGAAIIIVLLLNELLIYPELQKQKRLSVEVTQRQNDIRVMQEQLQQLAIKRQSNPDKLNRDKLEGLRSRIAEVDGKLAEEQRKFAPPDQIGTLLEQMLTRNRRLQLVDMRTLPVAAIGIDGTVGKPGAEKPPAEKPAADKPPAKAAGAAGPIYRHGVEIAVRGSYLDLLAYLRDLEKLPNQMYWGRLELVAGVHPEVTLKLSVYTLSLDLAWLIV